ncbi:unnamed protein product, partial [Ixodes persulcatus]
MVEQKLDASKHSKQRTTWECVDKCTVGPMSFDDIIFGRSLGCFRKRTGSFRVCDSTKADVPHHLLRNSEIETALTVTLISSLWLLGLVSILSVAHCYISDEHSDSVMFKPDEFFLVGHP